jgi:hypothetical protein
LVEQPAPPSVKEGAFSGGFVEAAGQSVRGICLYRGNIYGSIFESPSMLEQKGNLIIHAYNFTRTGTATPDGGSPFFILLMKGDCHED